MRDPGLPPRCGPDLRCGSALFGSFFTSVPGQSVRPNVQVSVHDDCNDIRAYFFNLIQRYVLALKVPGIALFLIKTKY